tara:strand:+ start:359 stop:502 length:144 start_codon:yes stop_codon:yes gene_type:complete
MKKGDRTINRDNQMVSERTIEAQGAGCEFRGMQTGECKTEVKMVRAS